MLRLVRLAVCLLLLRIAVACGGECEPLGSPLACPQAFAAVNANPDTLVLRHPGVAAQWSRRFLQAFAGGMEQGVDVAPKAGPFPGKRVIVFHLLPQELSEQLSYKNDRTGLCIRTLAFDAQKQRLTAKVLLAKRAPLMISFGSTLKEYRELALLLKAQRLRLVLRCRVTHAKGVKERGGNRVDLVLKNAELEARDLLEPLFVRKQDLRFAPLPKPALLTEHARRPAKTSGTLGPLDEALADAEMPKDPAAGIGVPEDPLRLTVGMQAFINVPYSEGCQPFRRGWVLTNPPPPARYEEPITSPVIAWCEHPGLPASMTTTLPKPLPPGLYKVCFKALYYRNRDRDNIVRIRLGDEEVQTAYWFGRFPWIVAPAVRLTRPAKTLTITAVQAGGGGRSEAPPYYRYWIAMETIFITNVMDDVDGAHLSPLVKTEEKE